MHHYPPSNLDPGQGRRLVHEIQVIIDKDPIFRVVLKYCKVLETQWTPLGLDCEKLIVKASRGWMFEACDLGSLVTMLWSNAGTEWPKNLTAKEKHGLLFFRAMCNYGNETLSGKKRKNESPAVLLEAMRKLYKLAMEPVLKKAARLYLRAENQAADEIGPLCIPTYGSACSLDDSKGAFRHDLRAGLHLRRITGVTPTTVRALYEFQQMLKQWDT